MPTITLPHPCLCKQIISSVRYKSQFHHLWPSLINPTADSESDWVYLVDTGLKSRDGKTARKVLLDIIKAFPEYDLKSDEGIDKAIEEMVTKLGEVVSFRESRDVEKKSTA